MASGLKRLPRSGGGPQGDVTRMQPKENPRWNGGRCGTLAHKDPLILNGDAAQGMAPARSPDHMDKSAPFETLLKIVREMMVRTARIVDSAAATP